jgi:glucose/arabinose dehydrogenase
MRPLSMEFNQGEFVACRLLESGLSGKASNNLGPSFAYPPTKSLQGRPRLSFSMIHRLPPSWRCLILTAGAAALTCTLARGELVNRWSFNQGAGSAPSGTTIVDSVSGSIATVKGIDATFTGNSLTLPGTTTGDFPDSTISAYIDLPNRIISSKTDLTIEIWATPLTSKNWQRLFDFGRTVEAGDGEAPGEWTGSTAPGTTTSSDGLTLAIQHATDLNTQRLEATLDGTVTQLDSALTTPTGTQFHYVVTYQSGLGAYPEGGRITWYRDGVQIATTDVSYALSQIEDVNNWLGRSQSTADSNANVSYNEVRVYDHALKSPELATHFHDGPETGLTHRWSFGQTGPSENGTVLKDSISDAPAVIRGQGATLNGTAIVLPGTTTGNQTQTNVSAYVDLPNGIISRLENLTIEAWATPISSKDYQRLFDFGNFSGNGDGLGATGEWTGNSSNAPSGSYPNDAFGLSLNTSTSLDAQQLYSQLNGQQLSGFRLSVNSSLATTAGQRYHYVVTFEKGVGTYPEAGGRQTWYRDGVLIATLDVPYQLSAIHDVNNWLGRSPFAYQSLANVSFDEFRVFSYAFTPTDVMASRDGGADSIPTIPIPVTANDAVTMRAGKKASVNVLANDTGSFHSHTVAIDTPPSAGTATVDANGRILYTNTSDVAADSFTYTVSGRGGTSNPATVNITFTNNFRIANPTLAMPSASPTTLFKAVDALPGVTFTEPICIASIPGNSKRMFVGERLAKIQLVPDVTATTPTKILFLDLQQMLASRGSTETIADWAMGENGLLGLAFHPNYATNGYFYVAYTVRINGGSYYQRVSRFKVSAEDPNVADPASELILIQQFDEIFNHNGGDLHFGPDGYLYYAAGDEANPSDSKLNSQKINKDFFSGIFRIDVDKKPGNLAPNPHTAIPTDNGVARFSVPADNPFIHTSLGGTWDGKINGVTVTPLSWVRTEFWAYGLRHPWRMSFDSLNGELWAGDVGQDTYEEVNLIQKGGNYGWVYREGAHDTNFTNPRPPTKPASFTSIDPVYEYVHASIAGGDAQFKGNSVCGGYVYRGSRFPSLYGAYIFCDSVAGHIWKRDPTTGTVTRLTGVPGVYGGLSTMGVDPSNNDLLFADYINGKILRLATGTADTTFPATLSATGLFSDLTDLSPSPGLLPYEPNLTFWSDHAVKRRWFGIPDSSSTMTWMLDENWTYPTGMLWVKHFDLETTRGNPATKRRIETRVVVKTDSGAYGVSYRWNDAQTQATLVPDEGAEFDLDIVENGTTRTQRWQIPSRSSCLTCHTPQAGHSLSFTTRQLNRDSTLNAITGNQLSLLYTGGYLANDPGSPNLLPRHVRPDESDYSLEARVRSYLAVNCSYCHHEGGTVAGANWDGSAHLTLAETNLINGIATNNGGDSLNKYVVRGDATHSIVLNRMAVTNGFTRMPPLGSTELDQTNIALVQEWITQSLPERLTYDEWRLAEFGSSSSSEGTASSDPDGDGQTNEQEFVANTDPRSPASFLATQLSADGANITLTFNVPEGRSALIETSADLNAWALWDIPGNNGLPLASGPVSFSGPASGAKQFFRLRLQEN